MSASCSEPADNVACRRGMAKGPKKRNGSADDIDHEIQQSQKQKRQHKSNTDIKFIGESSLSKFRHLATTVWIKAEQDFYDKGTKPSTDASTPLYSPFIPFSENRDPPVNHLANAAIEFARRFPYRRSIEEEEERNDEISSESPFLLVATRIRDNWEAPFKFQNDHAVRFMLVPGKRKNCSILFITKMAGPNHAFFDACISTDIDGWIISNELRNILCRLDAGGKWYQPDKSYRPKVPDRQYPDRDADARLLGKPYVRIAIEVEFAHRHAKALRMVGFDALDNPYTRFFLVAKIWRKDQAGDFAAAAVLWHKNDNGVVSVRRAVDFGTQRLEGRSKTEFEELGDATNMLPPVVEWIRPQPGEGHDILRAELESFDSDTDVPINDNWCLTLPAADLLYKVSSRRSTEDLPYCLNENPVIPDCVINLQMFAWQIHDEVSVE